MSLYAWGERNPLKLKNINSPCSLSQEAQEDITRSVDIAVTSGATGAAAEHFRATELVVQRAAGTALLGGVGLGAAKNAAARVLRGGL